MLVLLVLLPLLQVLLQALLQASPEAVLVLLALLPRFRSIEAN